MSKDDCLVESMAEMLIKQDEMVAELRNVKNEVSEVKGEITKLNLVSSENSRAILKLANQMEHFLDLEPREKN